MTQDVNPDTAPFGDCANARPQHIDNVQSHGVLVAIDAISGRIEYCSANSTSLFDLEPAELLGMQADRWLPDQWPALKHLVGREGSLDSLRFAGADQLLAIGHRSGPRLIFEFERAGPTAPHWWTHAKRTRFLEQLTLVHTPAQCQEFLARPVFEISGYDRVMIYRFLPDWNGEVAHEHCRPGVEGFLGLRFPASDIPPNARQLFTLNWQRSITDVDSAVAPILKLRDDLPALDLTYSTLRAAHPVHIQYLRNMGVMASVTLSIMVSGRLWGMVACHHLSPRMPPIEDRLAFEEMARMVSLHLENLLAIAEDEARSRLRQQLARLRGVMTAQLDDPRAVLSANLGTMRQMFGASGAWLRFEGEDTFTGQVPDAFSIHPLRDFLETLPLEGVSHYDTLPETLHPYRALSANASGLLFIPLGGADFVAMMRPEVVATVHWAGKPATREDSSAHALTPRKSFALWTQLVRNSSEPWTATDFDTGARLQTDLRLFIGTARWQQMAMSDALTGLGNRVLFEKRLQQEVRQSIARNTTFALHMIDLDKFKQVNDTMGHAAGDQLLQHVAARLTGALPHADTVARLGGDEFAVIQTRLESRAGAAAMANRIVRIISEPYTIDGKSVEIGASIGVSICPFDTAEESDLLNCADLALHRVKRTGRNAWLPYDPTLRTDRYRGIDGALLHHALRDSEFRLNYQPMVDARTGELRGLEAFLRWHKPDGAVVPAGDFLPAAEQELLGPPIFEWLLETVFGQYRQWAREGLVTVPVSINIGTREFTSAHLLGQIESMAARFGTGWQWLRLDVKEQSLLADVGHAIRKIRSLHEAGIGANLDNFGSGFAPLGYLTQLPFRGIKLDTKVFENAAERQSFDAMFNIVRGIAQVLKAELTVTKIETKEIMESLRNERVDILQGYAIGRPVEAAGAREWLTQTNCESPAG